MDWKTYASGNIESELYQLVSQAGLRNAMQPVQAEPSIFAAQRDTAAMHIQHGIVQVALRVREFAVHWPGSRDVGDVSACLL